MVAEIFDKILYEGHFDPEANKDPRVEMSLILLAYLLLIEISQFNKNTNLKFYEPL